VGGLSRSCRGRRNRGGSGLAQARRLPSVSQRGVPDESIAGASNISSAVGDERKSVSTLCSYVKLLAAMLLLSGFGSRLQIVLQRWQQIVIWALPE